MNFNDFGSSFVVLFQQMTINNWFIVIDLMSDTTGYTTAVRLFFCSFFVVVVLVLLNILIAMVLEIHSAVYDEVETKFAQIKMRDDLYKDNKGES